MRLGIRGVRVAHGNRCTVLVFPKGAVASGEVRGGAPATREMALLAPDKTIERIHAVALCGGSAFGLSVADGVMRYLEEEGIGFDAWGGYTVPIVPAMAIYDLRELGTDDRPGPDDGYATAGAAREAPVALGLVGAGRGATHGPDRRPGGIGVAVARRGRLKVAAVMVVNAAGEVGPGPGRGGIEQTTIGVVVTNAELTKLECYLAAVSGHDGFARALHPTHTRTDGDALVVASVGTVPAVVDRVRVLATDAVEAAIRSVVDGTDGAVDRSDNRGH